MYLPIIERDSLVLAALRLIGAERYQLDPDPNTDAEAKAEYAAAQLDARARDLVAALDDTEPTADADPHAWDEDVRRGGRASFIKALRDLAQFLADRPDVPIPDHAYTVNIDAWGDDAAQWAFVDAAAKAMGVTPTGREDTHYRAEVRFGPLTYQVLAIATRAMDDCAERTRLGNEAFAKQRAARGAAA